MQKVTELKKYFPHPGKVEWIGIRPYKGSTIKQKSLINALTDHGLEVTRLVRGLVGNAR